MLCLPIGQGRDINSPHSDFVIAFSNKVIYVSSGHSIAKCANIPTIALSTLHVLKATKHPPLFMLSHQSPISTHVVCSNSHVKFPVQQTKIGTRSIHVGSLSKVSKDTKLHIPISIVTMLTGHFLRDWLETHQPHCYIYKQCNLKYISMFYALMTLLQYFRNINRGLFCPPVISLGGKTTPVLFL